MNIYKQQGLKFFATLFFSGALGLASGNAFAQKATVKEENQLITTYPFDDPNPVAELSRSGRNHIYPYFKYEGYSTTSEKKEWKVVTLENPFIKVSVLPEVGGKIWGAIEKSTNEEFLYLNEVLKFRNIAMRGPWTSGGIEFNFGIVGHAPSTATPVDYIFREDSDGSVSCIVGALDLPSRTEWRVNITLPKDKAYFETNSLWYNPTPLTNSYYQWMNAAIEAGDDLQFFFPGQYHIGHDGDNHSWPINEEGVDISFYKNNNFGSSKSYHVLGKFQNYSGAYFHNKDFGYGHWSSYDDMPGKKIWIWSLSRSGAIWEDLLTDTDGQYVEVQTGRLFSQAQGSSSHTPFNLATFGPSMSDSWSEIWFPVKETGGISDATPFGSMNVTHLDGRVQIAINALQDIKDSLTVKLDGKQVFHKNISLAPMEIFKEEVSISSGNGTVEVAVGKDKLHYSSDPEAGNVNRPVASQEGSELNTTETLFQLAEDDLSSRNFDEALLKYQQLLEKDPNHSIAKARIAEIYYGRGEFDEALPYASQVLALNTYAPYGNYIFGLINRQMGDFVSAKAAFSWAARSMEFRSAAYSQLAEIAVEEGDFQEAKAYARKSLNYNNFNINAYMAKAISLRKLNQGKEADAVLTEILEIDPLNHFARFEKYLLASTKENLNNFTSLIRSELPHETYLELAVQYANMELNEEAVQVLEVAPSNPMVNYWLAFLHKNNALALSQDYLQKAQSISPAFVFPFRMESIPVLEWAEKQEPSWKTQYYLGLIYWNKGRKEEGLEYFAKPGDKPDFAPFYIARGDLFKKEKPSAAVEKDFQRAVQLNKNEWRSWHALINYYDESGAYDQALKHAKKAYKRFPDSYILGMEYAKSLLSNGQYKESLAVLDNLNVLPHEHSREGHQIFEQATISLALEHMEKGKYQNAIQELEKAREWPENLGVGKPYNPDERLQNYLSAFAYRQLGNTAKAKEHLSQVYNYTKENKDAGRRANRYIGAIVLKEFGEEKEAKSLLEGIKSSSPGQNKLTEWAAAKMNNDEAKANELGRLLKAENSKNVKGEYNMLIKAISAIQAKS